MCVVNLKALHLTKLFIRTFHKIMSAVATDSGYSDFKSSARICF